LSPGFRYIIEALTSNNTNNFTADLDPSLLLPPTTTPKDKPTLTAQIRRSLHLSQTRLAHRRPILVGHNPLLDLCFLHHTFLQPLPVPPNTSSSSSKNDNENNSTTKAEVEAAAAAFRTNIRHFFPRVLDTKHMASQLGGRFGAARGLGGLYEVVVGLQQRQGAGSEGGVVVVAEKGFDAREGGRGRAHDAGFDSWYVCLFSFLFFSFWQGGRGGGYTLIGEWMAEVLEQDDGGCVFGDGEGGRV
jgi:poly(A)-specific ribonuclease